MLFGRAHVSVRTVVTGLLTPSRTIHVSHITSVDDLENELRKTPVVAGRGSIERRTRMKHTAAAGWITCGCGDACPAA